VGRSGSGRDRRVGRDAWGAGGGVPALLCAGAHGRDSRVQWGTPRLRWGAPRLRWGAPRVCWSPAWVWGGRTRVCLGPPRVCGWRLRWPLGSVRSRRPAVWWLLRLRCSPWTGAGRGDCRPGRASHPHRQGDRDSATGRQSADGSCSGHGAGAGRACRSGLSRRHSVGGVGGCSRSCAAADAESEGEHALLHIAR
jgi:hypothetical protein